MERKRSLSTLFWARYGQRRFESLYYEGGFPLIKVASGLNLGLRHHEAGSLLTREVAMLTRRIRLEL